MNETDLRTAFDTIAGREAPKSIVNVSEAIRRGRRRNHIRHVTAGVAVLAVCAALFSVVVVVWPAPQHNTPTVTPTGTSVSPMPTSSRPTSTTPAVAVLTGNVVRLADGHTVTLRPGSNDEIGEPVATPDGFVFSSYNAAAGRAVWWQSDAGTATKITTSFSNFVVSADGATLVVAAAGSLSAVTAYALPSLAPMRTVQFSAPVMGPVVLNISGDWVLIGGANGDPAPSTALAWNLHTGYHTQLWPTATTWPIGITGGGKVIARYDTVIGTKTTRACYGIADVAAIAAGTKASGGHCMNSPTDVNPAVDLSPDGNWLVFPNGSLSNPGAWIIAVADINNAAAIGHRIEADVALVDVWDGDATFIARGGGITLDEDSYWKCGLDGGCTPLVPFHDSIPVKIVGR